MNHLGELAVSWTVTALFADKASHRLGSMTANVLRLSMAIVFLGLGADMLPTMIRAVVGAVGFLAVAPFLHPYRAVGVTVHGTPSAKSAFFAVGVTIIVTPSAYFEQETVPEKLFSKGPIILDKKAWIREKADEEYVGASARIPGKSLTLEK